MALVEDPCKACRMYNEGIKSAIDDMRNGDMTGIGKSEFYLTKMLEYKTDEEVYEAMKDACASCTNISVYNKPLLQRAIDKINDSENMLNLLPEDLRPEILKECMKKAEDYLNELLTDGFIIS